MTLRTRQNLDILGWIGTWCIVLGDAIYNKRYAQTINGLIFSFFVISIIYILVVLRRNARNKSRQSILTVINKDL